ncbi:hypothetical protein JTB14_008933 [Gonioctena quinquepunctata]|nr:hypothetical protein JTB14_008933 [Gonioctena quinquepunctata]
MDALKDLDEALKEEKRRAEDEARRPAGETIENIGVGVERELDGDQGNHGTAHTSTREMVTQTEEAAIIEELRKEQTREFGETRRATVWI